MLNTVVPWRAGVGAEWDCLTGRREHYFDSDGLRFSQHLLVSDRETACLIIRYLNTGLWAGWVSCCHLVSQGLARVFVFPILPTKIMSPQRQRRFLSSLGVPGSCPRTES